MNLLRICVFLLFAMAMLIGGCKASVETVEPEPKPKPKEQETEMKAPLAVYEATLNPAQYDEDIDLVRKAHAEERRQMEFDTTRDSITVEEEISQGFRIQIFSTPHIDEAAVMQGSVRQIVDDSVYVVYDPPVYKVRVGDFVTRLEANQSLSYLLDRGFPDAWIVSDRIVKRKIVRQRHEQVKPD
jgi:hypothetical protein